jgi:hypothetical protein
MDKTKLWNLIGATGLALASLLCVFFLMDKGTAGASPEVLPQEATFAVSGTVLNEAAVAISDVVVYAWNRYEGSGFVGDVTDSSGYFSVTLGQGNYELNFTPPCGSGYASQSSRGITGPPDRTLNVVLSSGHAVSGTVFHMDGSTPAGNVAIYAFNVHTADGFGLPPTDDQGHYCVGLVTGSYGLSFSPPPCLELGPHTEEITITGDTTLDVVLPPGFTVAGCVTDGLGEPVSGVQVYAEDPNIRGFGFAPTDGSGCYTGTLPFAGTPPTGVYDIQFIPPPGLGLGSVTFTDVVSTSAGCPNATLPVTLPAGYTLSGTITCLGKPIRNVFVGADPEGQDDPDNCLSRYGAFSVDDGSYALPLVPGTYRVEFIPPEAAGLDARAFTTVELVRDTTLNVEFCHCSGVWVSETVGSAGDVGRSTSLALAPTYPYTPQVSYYDVTSDSLKYAWLSGNTWVSERVDSGGGWTSVALIPTYPYTPCITYYDGASPSFWEWFLRYACRDGITWTIMTLSSNQRAGQGGVSLSLEPIYPFTPHISYYNPFGTIATLHHAYLTGTIWMSGTWVHEQVEPSGSSMGTWSSLALEPTYPYTPHISYYDRSNDDLKYARLSGTTWFTETVDSPGDVGWYTSLALDSSGNPHISYYDHTNGELKYAWLSGNAWLSETVDSAGGPWYGWGTSLALDRANRPYISYYDDGDLKFARFDGKVWIAETVDSKGDVGPFSSLALDPMSCPHISYYDAANGDLKYAYVPPHYIYLPLAMRNYP